MFQPPLSGTTGMLVVFVAAVAVVDLLTRRIPNALNLVGAALGIGMHVWSAGAPGLLQSGAGLLTGLLAFLPFYAAGGFGAGDVKAMAAIGTFLGVKGALLAAAWILIAGSVGGIAVLIAYGGAATLIERARRWAFQARATLDTGKVQLWPPSKDDTLAQRRFPYGLAIACGTIVYLAVG
jgi:prepilin peptidase CpaA